MAFNISLVQGLAAIGQFAEGVTLIEETIGPEEYRAQLPPRNGAGPTFFWKSNMSLDTPDLQSVQSQIPVTTLETAHFARPAEVQ